MCRRLSGAAHSALKEDTLVLHFLVAALLAALFAGGSWTHSASLSGSQGHYDGGNGGGPSGSDGHGGG